MSTESFGCRACLPVIPIRPSELQLKQVASLIEEPHFSVAIVACGACGQRFVSIFAERVDFGSGEDSQCTTVMPLTVTEAARMTEGVALAELSALGQQRRFLRDHWPAWEGSRAYVTGVLIGPHG